VGGGGGGGVGGLVKKGPERKNVAKGNAQKGTAEFRKNRVSGRVVKGKMERNNTCGRKGVKNHRYNSRHTEKNLGPRVRGEL